MSRITRFLRDDAGAAMVEFALVSILVFFPLVFGIVEFGRVVMSKSAITAAAREGVRYAIVHGNHAIAPADSTAVANHVKGRTALSPIAVRTTWTGLDQGDTVTVQVSYTYVPIVKFITGGRTFTSRSQQVIAY
jgi:Flp pilus assembly protein TadG